MITYTFVNRSTRETIEIKAIHAAHAWQLLSRNHNRGEYFMLQPFS